MSTDERRSAIRGGKKGAASVSVASRGGKKGAASVSVAITGGKKGAASVPLPATGRGIPPALPWRWSIQRRRPH
jgi:hypothetical protein